MASFRLLMTIKSLARLDLAQHIIKSSKSLRFGSARASSNTFQLSLSQPYYKVILLTRSIFIHLLQVPCTFSSAAVMDKIAFSSFACIFSKPNTILYAYLDTVAIKVKGVSGYKEEMSHSANNQKMDFLVHFSHLSMICIGKGKNSQISSLYLSIQSTKVRRQCTRQ